MYVISSHPKGGDNVNVIRSLCHENAFSLTAMLMINGLGTMRVWIRGLLHVPYHIVHGE